MDNAVRDVLLQMSDEEQEWMAREVVYIREQLDQMAVLHKRKRQPWKAIESEYEIRQTAALMNMMRVCIKHWCKPENVTQEDNNIE